MEKVVINLSDVADLLAGHVVQSGNVEIEVDKVDFNLAIPGDGMGGKEKKQIMSTLTDLM